VALRDPVTTLQWVGGPILLTLGEADQQTEKRLAPVPVHAAGSVGAGTGRIRFRIASVGLSVAPASVVVKGLPATATVTGPDSNGDVEAVVPEGLYRIGLFPPAAATGALAPAVVTTVALVNQLSDLGTLYMVLDSAVAKAQLVCASNADCGGLTCTAGTCLDWVPPPAAPASVPFCDASRAAASNCGLAGGPCALSGGFAGACAPDAVGLFTCVPCGTCCTADGATQLCAPLTASGCAGVLP
jgi:hypothetical protein